MIRKQTTTKYIQPFITIFAAAAVTVCPGSRNAWLNNCISDTPCKTYNVGLIFQTRGKPVQFYSTFRYWILHLHLGVRTKNTWTVRDVTMRNSFNCVPGSTCCWWQKQVISISPFGHTLLPLPLANYLQSDLHKTLQKSAHSCHDSRVDSHLCMTGAEVLQWTETGFYELSLFTEKQ